MKILPTIMISYFIIFGAVSPVWATVDFNSYLPIAGTPITPQFKFTKTVTIDYQEGGKLKNIFSGKTFNSSFSNSSDNNPDVRYLMNQINTEFANERKSDAKITNLNLEYHVSVIGNNEQVILDYNVILTPTLTNYLLNKGDNTPTVLDISWMGFAIKTPVTITTKQYSNLEINSPIGIIRNQFSEAYDILKGTAAERSLNQNLIDASSLIKYPIDRWNTLYDPTYTLTENAGPGYQGQKVTVTSFSHGRNDPFPNGLRPTISNMDFVADSKYHLNVVEGISTGTISVEGHANGYFIEGIPAISTVIGHTGFTGCPGCLSPDESLFRSILIISLGVAAVIGFWIFYFRRFRD